jgi:hypothetical protein
VDTGAGEEYVLNTSLTFLEKLFKLKKRMLWSGCGSLAASPIFAANADGDPLEAELCVRSGQKNTSSASEITLGVLDEEVLGSYGVEEHCPREDDRNRAYRAGVCFASRATCGEPNTSISRLVAAKTSWRFMGLSSHDN